MGLDGGLGYVKFWLVGIYFPINITQKIFANYLRHIFKLQP